ncbi:MAG: 2-oxoglutarate dehydrogenase complex dihydrolipoyllysine-residue succinyltransferase [Alphaproteobacteria bacterium]|uniref:2-oxoglutarate dehydrogenase complex dihydrolipoyllysine-residue succinyltransferase n=1 Tax=Bradyrhizobium sp. TaxID=376 RepID=UPI001ED12B4E|nr:2-oxoglutarate dehydrogenase complex dihydrolipoyllysine-residue succinyltransferase [Bradyrhizobium sp.]MBV9570806.1 2-oxoglutarate dehydrogenase complex dihydrolipoyllysine-residue succinyltransferase [Alphaproteobacteria bacterium]MBV9979057.1 2-oxoglutarate dehydrogenase complex dihydrolipoyllysine-residue succinyltransferase [Bradyrhizobium sp.]
MSIQIKVPAMGESVTEATVARWFKKEGDSVSRDEPVLELETDKVTVEVPAPADGAIESISVQAGATVQVGAVLGAIAEGKKGTPSATAATRNPDAAAPKTEAPKSAPPRAAPVSNAPAMPSVRRISEESDINPAQVSGTGKDGRVTKGDMLAALEARAAQRATTPAPVEIPSGPRPRADREERVKMSRLRRTIALRLKESQNTAAQLTTFNEVDMSDVMRLRAEYKDSFEKKHGVRLGFMGFFVKACIAALKELPNVNAEIEGDDIVYKNYYDIGVAVSTERGLVVPVVRDADELSLAQIEAAIADFGAKARDNKLKLEELQGGTFTISNGGVFGSLMSTPILNAPQSGVLGMHKIQQRPVAIEGKVEIRPMMYLALSYDHRLIDGREAVTFLVRVKENLEDPQRLLLDV